MFLISKCRGDRDLDLCTTSGLALSGSVSEQIQSPFGLIGDGPE